MDWSALNGSAGVGEVQGYCRMALMTLAHGAMASLGALVVMRVRRLNTWQLADAHGNTPL